MVVLMLARTTRGKLGPKAMGPQKLGKMTREYEERLKRKTYALTMQLAARHTKVEHEIERVEGEQEALRRMFDSTDTDSIDALVRQFEDWEDRNYRVLNRIADLREELVRAGQDKGALAARVE